MAANNFLEVAAEAAIQCYAGTTLLKYLERFGEQTRARCIGWQQLGNDTGIRFDVNLVAIRRTRHESVKIACRFNTRDVNDRHATIIQRLP